MSVAATQPSGPSMAASKTGNRCLPYAICRENIPPDTKSPVPPCTEPGFFHFSQTPVHCRTIVYLIFRQIRNDNICVFIRHNLPNTATGRHHAEGLHTAAPWIYRLCLSSLPKEWRQLCGMVPFIVICAQVCIGQNIPLLFLS